eukprot:360686-Chlamydomonas_euryale.AAC.3
MTDSSGGEVGKPRRACVALKLPPSFSELVSQRPRPHRSPEATAALASHRRRQSYVRSPVPRAGSTLFGSARLRSPAPQLTRLPRTSTGSESVAASNGSLVASARACAASRRVRRGAASGCERGGRANAATPTPQLLQRQEAPQPRAAIWTSGTRGYRGPSLSPGRGRPSRADHAASTDPPRRSSRSRRRSPLPPLPYAGHHAVGPAAV